jgi:hypothetical protein
VVDRVRILSSIDAARTIASSTICSSAGGCGNPHELVLVLLRTTAFVIILDEATHVWAVITQTKSVTMWMNFIV